MSLRSGGGQVATLDSPLIVLPGLRLADMISCQERMEGRSLLQPKGQTDGGEAGSGHSGYCLPIPSSAALSLCIAPSQLHYIRVHSTRDVCAPIY